MRCMSTEILEIMELLGPSEQGAEHPYLCRAEDGHLYYVKGRQTNRSSLWYEWICAALAREFGLQVPDFRLVHVCQELLDEAPREWRDLGAGVAFGSQQHASSVWLEKNLFDRIPDHIQRDVLVFDWWVRNTDRQKHNPNLLWDPATQELVVIDHNLAFDPDFSASGFLENHLFAAQWPHIVSDLVARTEYASRLSAALLAGFDVACDNAPEEWRWENPERDVAARVDLDAMRAFLSRCEDTELWRTV